MICKGFYKIKKAVAEIRQPPKDSQKLYNKRNFKACEAWETAAYLGVCEDFEGERNAEITLLGDF